MKELRNSCTHGKYFLIESRTEEQRAIYEHSRASLCYPKPHCTTYSIIKKKKETDSIHEKEYMHLKNISWLVGWLAGWVSVILWIPSYRKYIYNIVGCIRLVVSGGVCSNPLRTRPPWGVELFGVWICGIPIPCVRSRRLALRVLWGKLSMNGIGC